MTTDEIFQFIQEHPGSTGYDIWQEWCRRTPKPAWVCRWFGEDSLIAAIFFEPASAKVYPPLARLEASGKIFGSWVWRPGSKYRRRIYFATGQKL